MFAANTLTTYSTRSVCVSPFGVCCRSQNKRGCVSPLEGVAIGTKKGGSAVSDMIVKDKILDEERALYGSCGITVENCRFEGPTDGESALKESQHVEVRNSLFALRYPFWHNFDLKIDGCEMTDTCRAALWYTNKANITDTKLHGIKALRECVNIDINNCDIDSPEFGWSVSILRMNDTTARSEYFMMRADHLSFNNVTLTGNYSFQYIKDSSFENCTFNTKDAFWHAKNVTVKNCIISGEYLGWYSENLTLEDCLIKGTQPLCYCKGLKLINCRMEEADLAFEKSDVEAVITTPVISIKNPYKGSIVVPEVGQIIMDDENAKAQIRETD